jgi:hypothetical protein
VGSCNGKSWYILRPFGLFYDHLVYFMTIWFILRPLEIFYGHLVYFVAIWYIYPHFGTLYQEKSGNPGHPANGQFLVRWNVNNKAESTFV